MLITKPLAGFGMEISGVDLSQPLDEATQKSLLKVFHENGVIFLREQNLDFGQFEEFAALLGHPKTFSRSSTLARPSFRAPAFQCF